MHKIAIFSSLPPVKSGISYYSALLSESLSEFYNITFFVDNNYEPADEFSKYADIYRVRNINDTVRELRNFDVVIYHFGNNKYHVYMYDIAMRMPGIVILHDFILHHLVYSLTLEVGNKELYLAKVAKLYPEYLDTAKGIVSNDFYPDFFAYPFNDEVVNSSLCVIVHNNCTKDRLEAKFVKPIFLVPMVSLYPKSSARRTAKKYLEISCIGFVIGYKRVHVLLSVFQKLSEKYMNIKLNVIGEFSPEMSILLNFVRENKLEDVVNFTGFCSEEILAQYWKNSDICVNLRYPSAGETSATLVTALAEGIPTIVSKYQTFDEFPDDVVLKVPLDSSEKSVLYAYLERLIVDVEFRNALGDSAKKYIGENQSLNIVTEKYRKIIDSAIFSLREKNDSNLKLNKEKMENILFSEIREMLV